MPMTTSNNIENIENNIKEKKYYGKRKKIKTNNCKYIFKTSK